MVNQRCPRKISAKFSQKTKSMRSRPNLYQIGNKTCCVTKVSEFYVEKVSGLYINRLESVILSM